MFKYSKKIATGLMLLASLIGIFISQNWFHNDSISIGQKIETNKEVSMGHANGSYTLKQNVWLVFDWPYNTCVRAYPSHGMKILPDMNQAIIKFRSRKGEISREIRTLQAGETWKGYTC